MIYNTHSTSEFTSLKVSEGAYPRLKISEPIQEHYNACTIFLETDLVKHLHVHRQSYIYFGNCVVG